MRKLLLCTVWILGLIGLLICIGLYFSIAFSLGDPAVRLTIAKGAALVAVGLMHIVAVVLIFSALPALIKEMRS